MPISERILVDGIEDGMTRDEVIGVLGDEFYSHVPLSWAPRFDSFPYTDSDGQTKFVWIYYEQGGVVRATDGHPSIYFVE